MCLNVFECQSRLEKVREGQRKKVREGQEKVREGQAKVRRRLEKVRLTVFFTREADQLARNMHSFLAEASHFGGGTTRRSEPAAQSSACRQVTPEAREKGVRTTPEGIRGQLADRPGDAQSRISSCFEYFQDFLWRDFKPQKLQLVGGFKIQLFRQNVVPNGCYILTKKNKCILKPPGSCSF